MQNDILFIKTLISQKFKQSAQTSYYI